MFEELPAGPDFPAAARGMSQGLRGGLKASPTCAELTARDVDAALRSALDDLQRAEQNAVLCFAEIVRRKLYQELGYATIHLYASEALGFSQSRTYRFLRLAEDLERLPRLRAALATGEVGWTKAREVVKVAGPATEEQWIEAAKRTGRRGLEAQVQRAQKLRAAKRRANPGQGEIAALCAAPATGGGVFSTATGAGASGEPFVATAGESLAALAGEPLADDARAAVVFRLDPLQLTRYEVLIERIRKVRVVSAATSREEILLLGLEELLHSAGGSGNPAERVRPERGAAPRGSEAFNREEAQGGSETRTGDGWSAGQAPAGLADRGGQAPTNGADRDAVSAVQPDLSPRGHSATCYKLVIYKCDTCRRAFVQTSRGEKEIGSAQLAAIACDAVVARPGARNQGMIAPAVRAAVLARDRHRCRAPGCVNTRFLEVHHIVAREQGGSNRAENLVTLCSSCHRQWHARGLGAHFLRRGRPGGARKAGQRDPAT